VNPPILATFGVCKRYGSATALEPTDLEVREGEFLTLLGPSGSGKTTLLMMIAGLTGPSSGRIELAGRDVTSLPPYRRDIGVVFQNYALFPHLSVRENVAFPLRMRRVSDADIARRVSQALDRVRLAEHAEKLPRQLSGGQQQRVAFARALVFEPPIVLMDEPLGALDRKLRDELKLEIRKLHKDLGTTIVYVTHDQEEAMLLSDRICLMNQARVEQIGPPKVLYDAPQTRFAAEFLGDSNILSGRIAGGALEICGIRLPMALSEANGGERHVMIRPERVRLVDASAPGAVPGTVADRVDLGGVIQLRLMLDAGIAIKATLLGSASVSCMPSDRVSIAFDSADFFVLPGLAKR
jgi:putative spermidine/putrescine transport system ATP-binding protein